MDMSLQQLKTELDRTEAVMKELSMNFRLIISMRIEIAADPLVLPYAEAVGFERTETNDGFAFTIENLDSFTLFYAHLHDLYTKIAELTQAGINTVKTKNQ